MAPPRRAFRPTASPPPPRLPPPLIFCRTTPVTPIRTRMMGAAMAMGTAGDADTSLRRQPRARWWPAGSDGDGAEACPRRDSALRERHHVSLRRHAVCLRRRLHHGLLPLLCSRLLAIEYLDVAEQVSQMCFHVSEG
ncbi:hypothetical protein SEVIR_2G021001v4 [Setaria viridis]